MIIDLTENGTDWYFSYESDISPHVGDTVTFLTAKDNYPPFVAKILTVDHFIGPSVGRLADYNEKLITCEVEVYRDAKINGVKE